MLKVAYIGFGNSVCRYHLPYVEKRKDFIDVKYIYRLETEINEEKRAGILGLSLLVQLMRLWMILMLTW